MSVSRATVTQLLADPLLAARFGPAPSWSEVLGELESFGVPLIAMNARRSSCRVVLPGGTMVAGHVETPGNPAGAALACVRELLALARDGTRDPFAPAS